MRLHLYPNSDPPLPYSRPPADETPIGLALSPADVAAFDALVHELNPDALRADATRLRLLACWLEHLPPDEATRIVESRLQRVGHLGAMLIDEDWDTAEALRIRASKLLDYVDRDDDLIPDHVPRLGLLDDALLIELAWPVFAWEVENYRDFCEYRHEHRLHGVTEEHRRAWLHERLLECALWQHQHDARMRHYADVSVPERMFRVG